MCATFFCGYKIFCGFPVYILPVLLYGCETWTITRTLEKRLDAFDTWCLRKILRIPYTRITNQRDSLEYHRVLASFRWGEVLPPEVLWTPGLLGPWGRSPPCHHRCSKTTNRLEENRWTTKNHLAENNRWGCSASELWGPYGMEEGKR